MIDGRRSGQSVICCVFAASFFAWAAAGPALGARAGGQRWEPPPPRCPPPWRACGQHILPVPQACPGPGMGLSVTSGCLGTREWSLRSGLRGWEQEKLLKFQMRRPTSGLSGRVLPCPASCFSLWF